MRQMVLGVVLCLAAALPAHGQEDETQPAASSAAPVRHGHESAREAERAAALARGRKRFFEEVTGFDHKTDAPLPSLPPLPTSTVPPPRKR